MTAPLVGMLNPSLPNTPRQFPDVELSVEANVAPGDVAFGLEVVALASLEGIAEPELLKATTR